MKVSRLFDILLIQAIALTGCQVYGLPEREERRTPERRPARLRLRFA
ncbi:MAG: hypothetical protein GY719_05090 [bacterium]|nr:hypothetical protein [bacterium]